MPSRSRAADDRQDAADQQAFTEAITVIALVRQQRFGAATASSGSAAV